MKFEEIMEIANVVNGQKADIEKLVKINQDLGKERDQLAARVKELEDGAKPKGPKAV